jgi:hypothetical protein
MFAKPILLALVFVGGVAHADDGGAPVDGGVASDGGAASVTSVHAGSPIGKAPQDAEGVLKQASSDFDFGDYQAVVEELRPLVDALELTRSLPQKADRLEALRVYGIACTLTSRRTAAEGAFLLLLREEPSTRLNPALVRPEAVAFFDEVRARHRDELLAAYRQTRPRYYWVLDLVPVAGQFQNRQWKKGVVFGAVELGLLVATIVTGGLLGSWQGDTHTFDHHERAYEPLKYSNNICFGVLLGVTAAGLVDAFVVGGQRQKRERQVEARLGL